MLEAAEKTITLANTGSVFQINETARLHHVEEAEPLFFKTTHGKRETYTMYRGQLIVRNTVQFSNSRPVRKTTVYLFLYDPNTKDWMTLHSGKNIADLRGAKKHIDHVLDTGVDKD